jgi:predicted metal-dependent hydrolase
LLPYPRISLSDSYVLNDIIHELCHLKHMNHSKKFWDMVAKFMPDYKEAEKELKK